MTHHQLLPDPQLQHEIDRHEIKSQGISFTMGVGFGILVGLCAGLLIAPKPGKETIQQIEDKVSDLKARASELKDKAIDTRDLAAEKWEAARERILHAVASGKTRAAELLGKAEASVEEQQHHEELPTASDEPIANSETLSGNPNLRM